MSTAFEIICLCVCVTFLDISNDQRESKNSRFLTVHQHFSDAILWLHMWVLDGWTKSFKILEHMIQTHLMLWLIYLASACLAAFRKECARNTHASDISTLACPLLYCCNDCALFNFRLVVGLNHKHVRSGPHPFLYAVLFV